MIAVKAYIRRETAISIAINAILSFVFFMLIFGLSRPVMVWGAGHYVFDFLPQGLMIGVMATAVPGFLARKALRKGTVEPFRGASRLPRNLGYRAIVVGLASMISSVLGAAAVLSFTEQTQLPAVPAMLAKILFGALLALLVTPPGLRAALKPQ